MKAESIGREDERKEKKKTEKEKRNVKQNWKSTQSCLKRLKDCTTN